jgi:hypothetical protein
MFQPKRTDRPVSLHHCPVCQHPQTKIQRLLGDSARGSTNYVCARASECSLGIDLAKVTTWVAV